MSTTTGYQDQFQAGTMRTNPWTFSAMVGFFAGLFWGLGETRFLLVRIYENQALAICYSLV